MACAAEPMTEEVSSLEEETEAVRFDANEFFSQMNRLMRKGLHEAAVRLGEIIVDHEEDGFETLTPGKQATVLTLIGDCYTKLRQPAQAEYYYVRAVAFKKRIPVDAPPKRKGKRTPKPTPPKTATTEHEVKYRLAKSQRAVRNITLALNTMDSIPIRNRAVKMSLFLGKLRQERGQDNGAINCFKAVLKIDPLCVDAVRGLFELGMKLDDLLAYLLMVFPSGPEIFLADIQWYMTLLVAEGAINEGDYERAIDSLNSLEYPWHRNPHVFRKSVFYSGTMGKALYLMGDREAALSELEKALRTNIMLAPHMEFLAIIYSTESCVKPVTAAKRVVPFELLLRRLERYKLNSLDRFLTRAYYARMRKMNALASGIVVKLDKMYRNNPEVTLLRGVLLMSDREWREAVGVLKYAIELAPYRFESYEMLVEAYLSITMIKEAIQAAKDCIEKIGETERSLTLCAGAMKRDTSIPIPKLRTMLERANEMNPRYLPSVYSLVELLENCHCSEESVELLKKTLELVPDYKLQVKLSNIYRCRFLDDEKCDEHELLAMKLIGASIVLQDEEVEKAKANVKRSKFKALLNPVEYLAQNRRQNPHVPSDILQGRNRLRALWVETGLTVRPGPIGL